MDKELEKLLLAERKYKRELAELRVVRQRFVGVESQVAKDKLKMIDAEIAIRLK